MNEFDIATLIYCDYGVLSPADRAKLLAIVKKALKPGGLLVLDGWTRRFLDDSGEYRDFSFSQSGFWSDKPHLCLEQRIVYGESDNYLDQYVVLTADGCRNYNIWNQIFTTASLDAELKSAGFAADFFGDVTGAPLTEDSKTLCAVARAL